MEDYGSWGRRWKIFTLFRQGDSGGPLTVDGILVGLVSWAQGCAQLEWPTVFTRVSSYTDWIQKYSEWTKHMVKIMIKKNKNFQVASYISVLLLIMLDRDWCKSTKAYITLNWIAVLLAQQKRLHCQIRLHHINYCNNSLS